jgi:hypothetical protein
MAIVRLCSTVDHADCATVLCFGSVSPRVSMAGTSFCVLHDRFTRFDCACTNGQVILAQPIWIFMDTMSVADYELRVRPVLVLRLNVFSISIGNGVFREIVRPMAAARLTLVGNCPHCGR